MEIVVNTRLLIKDKLEGIGWFMYESLKRIAINHPEVHFYFLFDRDYDPEFIFSENITPIVIGPKARHPFLFVWWFELEVAALLEKIKPDLFLSPDGFLSLRASCAQLPVIHDINFEHFKGNVPWLVQKYYNYFFPRFAKKAKRIATVSEFSKQDISKTYGIDMGLIDVVYNGVGEQFKLLGEQEIEKVKMELTNGNPYFFYVGSLHPRKNILNMIRAFEKFKNRTKCFTKFLIVGEKYFWTKEMEEYFKNTKIKDDIIFTGRCDSIKLARYMASSLALVYVPFFEGFGIPIVEGFKCGVPVITSNTSSMPEVAGEAAILVDPYNIDSIVEALFSINKEEDLRKELIAKGTKRVSDFSCDRTANLLWESIIKTINS